MTMPRQSIPTFVDIPVIDMKTGKFSPEWKAIMQQLLTQLMNTVSNQGLVAPSQTAANVATIASAKRLSGIPAGFEFITLPGTILFDTSLVNGGSAMNPNGQLVVLLADQTFHPITNT